jgi:hypothetical protein
MTSLYIEKQADDRSCLNAKFFCPAMQPVADKLEIRIERNTK